MRLSYLPASEKSIYKLVKNSNRSPTFLSIFFEANSTVTIPYASQIDQDTNKCYHKINKPNSKYCAQEALVHLKKKIIRIRIRWWGKV